MRFGLTILPEMPWAEAAPRWRAAEDLGFEAETVPDWFAGLATARATLDQALVDAGRDPATFPRYLNLDGGPAFALQSVDLSTEMAGRATETGFTDVITHWPRTGAPYAGSEATLDTVARDVMPGLRA